MIDTTASAIAANGGSAVFPSFGGGGAPAAAPLATKITNAPRGFDIAPGANLSGTYNYGNGALTKTSDSVASVPVVTGKSAQDDYNQKYATFQSILDSIKNQTTALSQAQAYAAEKKAADDVTAAQLKVQQQGVDIKKAELDAKNYALGLTSGGTPKTDIGTGTETPNATAAGGAVTTGLGNPQTQPNNPPGGTPAPQAGSSTGDTANAGIQTALNNETSALNTIQGAKDINTQNSLTLLDSLMKGTIPLSAPQQALVTSLQNQLVQNENDQRQANAAFTGAVTEAAFRAGGEYTPEQMSGQIHTAISAGVAKIQALDNSAAKTIAELEQSYQKDNFDIINKQYGILDKALSDKADAITKTYSDTVKAIQDARDFSEKTREFNTDQQMKQQQQDLEVKKYDLSVQNAGVDNKLKLAQIAKIYNDMNNADLSAAGDWAKNIRAGTAKLSDVPKNLKNAVAANLANGTPQGTNALLTSTQASLKELNDMVNNDTGNDALPGIVFPGMTTGFRGAVGAKGPSSLFGILGHPMAGTAAANFDAKAAQVVNEVVIPNLSLLHGLGRVTDREFRALQSSITSLGHTDDKGNFSSSLSEGEFKTELKNITDRVNSLAAENDPTTMLQNFYTANPQNASQVDSLRKANPTMTPDQILQLVQP